MRSPSTALRCFDDAPIIQVEGRTYPVEVIYAPLDEFGTDAAEGDEREAQAKLRTCSELPPDMRVVIPYAEGISSTEIRARILQAGEPGNTHA